MIRFRTCRLSFLIALSFTSVVYCSYAQSQTAAPVITEYDQVQFSEMISYWNNATGSEVLYSSRFGKSIDLMIGTVNKETNTTTKAQLADNIISLTAKNNDAIAEKIYRLRLLSDFPAAVTQIYSYQASTDTTILYSVAASLLYLDDYTTAKPIIFANGFFDLLAKDPVSASENDLLQEVLTCTNLEDLHFISFALHKLGNDEYLLSTASTILQSQYIGDDRSKNRAIYAAIRTTLECQEDDLMDEIAYYANSSSYAVRICVIEALAGFKLNGYSDANIYLYNITNNCVYKDVVEAAEYYYEMP